MEIDSKLKALAEIVKEAAKKDKDLLEESEFARARWKEANEALTTARKSFDDYVASVKAELLRTGRE